MNMSIYEEIDYILVELEKLKNVITEKETEIDDLEKRYNRGEISQKYYHTCANLKTRYESMETRLNYLRSLLG
jgi:hypothetical protein